MNIKNTYLFLLFIVLFSCEKEIEVNIEGSEQKIVVEGHIQPNYPIIVSLTKSKGYFEPYTSNELTEINVTDAIVSVTRVSDQVTRQLQFFAFDEESGFGIYTDLDLGNPFMFDQSFAIFGERYKLEIIHEEDTITSVTSIPFAESISEPLLDSIWFVEDENSPFYGDFHMWLNDPDTMGNNYLIESKRIAHWEGGQFSPDIEFVPALWAPIRPDMNGVNGQSFETFFERGEGTSFFSEDSTDGGTHGMGKREDFGNFKSSHFTVNQQNDTIWHKTDTVLIRISMLDKNSYEFWKTVELQESMNGNPFGEPQNLKHNIDGGYGIWEGKGALYYKVYAEKGITFIETYSPPLFDMNSEILEWY